MPRSSLQFIPLTFIDFGVDIVVLDSIFEFESFSQNIHKMKTWSTLSNFLSFSVCPNIVVLFTLIVCLHLIQAYCELDVG